MQIGEQIRKLRKKQGLTQATFAERLFVTPQAVSQWERGVTDPETDKLADIAAVLHTTVNKLTAGEASEQDWTIADALFSPDHMYSRIAVTAELKGLRETYAALRFMKEAHKGQYRKPSLFSDVKVPYIVHPLMMACHAHALGIREDKILASILLHDVCEDCGVAPEELPFSEEVREAVRLLSFQVMPGETRADAKERYYAAIAENQIARIVKILDRCNNISTMASSFTQKKLVTYVNETETYVMPLLEQAKYAVPEYADAFYLLKYHMRSVLESIKAMAAR